MCGFVGFFRPTGLITEDYQQTIKKMLGPIHHRGPDDQGAWYDQNEGIVLGHQRLSIFDLSSAGHQPMTSACSRYVIVYNGEIYNFQEIKRELDQQSTINWQGHSDTEVLINAISLWGLEKTLDKCTGMFSFAFWDKREKLIHLVRDRAGEKPLYYGWDNGLFFFGSDLNSFTQHPEWLSQINEKSVSLYFKYTNVPAPYSIYKNIFKALPAEHITLNSENQSLSKRKYWDIGDINVNNSMQPIEAIERTHSLIKNSIAKQMLADVPVGCFLSGGIDSSLVSAIMQSQSSTPIHTFTIGFNDQQYNEAPYAADIARHLGTNHHEIYLNNNEVVDAIRLMPKIFSEPFADASQIPTYLVSKVAKKYVTVSLSGDGGDELFGGYTRYKITQDIWKKVQFFPAFIRNLAAHLILSVPQFIWSQILSPFLRYQNLGQKAHTLADLIRKNNMAELYDYFMSSSCANNIMSGDIAGTISTDHQMSSLRDMMLHDFNTYLPNDILCKVDRTAMFNSLETRVPLLDHRLIEFSRSIPESLLQNQGEQKWVLKEILKQYVPEKLFNRPKMGFGIPIDQLIKNELRDWGEEQMEKIYNSSFFNKEAVQKIWSQFLKGNHSCTPVVWSMIMFGSWEESGFSHK